MARSTISTVTALAAVLAVALITASCGSAGPAQPGSSTHPPASSGRPRAPRTQAPGGQAPGTSPAPAATSFPASLKGKDVESIPTSQRIVALTFDAGANADGLPSILQTLRSQHVPATFFLTGDFAARYPAMVRAIVTGGYRLGNHTATHPHLPALSDAAIARELSRARSQIMAAGGTDPRPLFRFPFGDRTSHDITVVNNAGYVAVRWTVDTLGWKGTSGGASVSSVISRVVAAARPGEIVLMHTGSNPDDHTTLDASALLAVITRLRGLGYGFVSLDALLSPDGQTAGCDTGSWRTPPVSLTRQPSVPPVPVVTGIRAGTHPECGYDRVVVDISGQLPGYQVRYVPSVTADPSGQPVAMPGSAYLLITIRPAQGHSGTGASTIAPRSLSLSYPVLRGYKVTGDVEGVITIALGLASTASVRVGELPGRLYLDVRR